MSSEDSLLRLVLESIYFYTTGECRDLLFHVQEHVIALPEIEAFLDANGLQFTEFFVDPPIRDAFAKRFPDPGAQSNLDRWHTFETEFPNTFAAMYRFSVRKPDSRSSAAGR